MAIDGNSIKETTVQVLSLWMSASCVRLGHPLGAGACGPLPGWHTAWHPRPGRGSIPRANLCSLVLSGVGYGLQFLIAYGMAASASPRVPLRMSVWPFCFMAGTACGI